MKKLLIGFIAGAAVASFSILFSGCNHHDRDRAEVYFITSDIDCTDEYPCYGDSEWCNENGQCDEHSNRDHENEENDGSDD